MPPRSRPINVVASVHFQSVGQSRLKTRCHVMKYCPVRESTVRIHVVSQEELLGFRIVDVHVFFIGREGEFGRGKSFINHSTFPLVTR